nr:hypothetical protein [Tanacetum cinerariifolium]
MALPPRDQRHQYLRFQGLRYTDADIIDFKKRLGRIYGREIHKPHKLEAIYFGLRVTYCEGDGVRWIRRILGRECEEYTRQGDLSAYWVGISSAEDFLITTLSYTLIRDLMLRLCHRLIAYIITRRSQAPEKVTVIDLLYLRGMDICKELDDTWAWVAPGPERQQVTAAGALKVAEGATDVDEGDQAVLAPVQAPQPPAAEPARTMT